MSAQDVAAVQGVSSEGAPVTEQHDDAVAGQAVADENRPNGVVRPKGKSAGYGSLDGNANLGPDTVPIRSADASQAPVQGRMQASGAGNAMSASELLAQVETATGTHTVQDQTAASSTQAGVIASETQAGAQIRSQGPAGEASLVEQGLGGGFENKAADNGYGPTTVFHTPRSGGSSHIAGFAAFRGGAQGQWPGWVSRLGELFKAPPIPKTWMPSPIPSPPMPRQGEEPGLSATAGRMDPAMAGGLGLPKPVLRIIPPAAVASQQKQSKLKCKGKWVAC